MNQNQLTEGVQNKKKVSLLKSGIVLCAAIVMLASGGIAANGIVGNSVTSAEKSKTSVNEENDQNEISEDEDMSSVETTVSFRKAGVDEYDMALKSVVTTTTAATTETTTTETTTTAASVKEETKKTTTAAPKMTEAPATVDDNDYDYDDSYDYSSNASVINYTGEEFDMFCCVLQHEVGYCSEASKIAVANVIINRVKAGFSSTIKGVLTAPGQFTAVSCYYNGSCPPTSNTIECARRALAGEGSAESKGATFYYSYRYAGRLAAFECKTFCMELEGQRFFK